MSVLEPTVHAPDPTARSAPGAAQGARAERAPEALTRSDFEPVPREGLERGPSRPSLSYWQDAFLRLRKNKQALVSLGIFISLVLFTVLGPFLWR